MARLKARYPRGCLICKSTLPRAEWKPHHSAGYCRKHYDQERYKWGKCKADDCTVRFKPKSKDSRQGYCRQHDYLLLREPHRTADAVERTRNKFASQIVADPDLGCWLWEGRDNDKEYGLISVGNHDWLAHRYAYGAFIGGHEPRLTLDHVCGVRKCVRPDHLMPMTRLRNTDLEHSRKNRTRQQILRDLALIPDMPPGVMLWAMVKGLPVGKADPDGEPFAYGLDGQPFPFVFGPAAYPPVAALS